MFFEKFILGYESVLHWIAELTVHTFELIGIAIIIGSVRALMPAFRTSRKKQPLM